MTLAGTAHPNQNREVLRPNDAINKKSTNMPVKKNKPVDILLNKLGRHALAASPPKNKELYMNSSMDNRNVPIKVPNRSKFYVPIDSDQNVQSNSLQSRVVDLQSRTRQAVQRLLKVSEGFEQQCLPQQQSMIIELRDIASLLNEGLMIQQEEVMISEPMPVSQLPSRSNSISNVKLPSRSNSVSNPNADRLAQRRPTLNGKECEMVEMHFARMKNF